MQPTRFHTLILSLLLFGISGALTAQEISLTIAVEDTLILEGPDRATYDSVVVRGTLSVELPPGATFSARHVRVDGGRLVVISTGGEVRNLGTAPWHVGTGGELVVTGPRQLFPWTGGITVAAGANAFHLKNVGFLLPTPLTLHGGRGMIASCSLAGPGELLRLDGASDITVSDTEFTTTGARALTVSPAGLGADNVFTRNAFTASPDSGAAAVYLGSPLQVFLNNTVTSHGDGAAVRYAIPPGYEKHVWDNSDNRFVFRGNRVVAGRIAHGTGVVFPDYRLRAATSLRGNHVRGFDLGADAGAEGVNLRQWEFYGNARALHTSSTSLEASTLDGGEIGRTAIVYHNPQGTVRPRLRDVRIKHYNLGLRIHSPIAEGNYVTDLRLEEVLAPYTLPTTSGAGLFFPTGLPAAPPPAFSPPTSAAPGRQDPSLKHPPSSDPDGHSHHSIPQQSGHLPVRPEHAPSGEHDHAGSTSSAPAPTPAPASGPSDHAGHCNSPQPGNSTVATAHPLTAERDHGGSPALAPASTPAPASGSSDHAGHAGHGAHAPGMTHDHAAPPSRARVLLPADHAAVTPACRDYAGWQDCPETHLGELTLSTGFGQSDPIHEHDRELGTVTLRTSTDTLRYVAEHQELKLLLGTDRAYALNIPTLVENYDLSLVWSSIGDTPLLLSIPYPHGRPVVFRALGFRIPASTSRAEMNAAAASGWYFDAATGVVHLKLYSGGREREFTLYNEDVWTEPTPVTDKVWVSTTTTQDGTTFAYQLPAGTPYELIITDVYGAERQRFAGRADGGTIRHRYRPTGPARPGWYFLYVGGHYRKGPYAPLPPTGK